MISKEKIHDEVIVDWLKLYKSKIKSSVKIKSKTKEETRYPLNLHILNQDS